MNIIAVALLNISSTHRYGKIIFSFAIRHAAGVSLKVKGVSVPSDSIVDLDDVLYRVPINGFREDPSNANPTLHDGAVLCETDLVDCCASPRTVRGDWYLPNGNRVIFETGGNSAFRSNRGPNELRNGRQFNGSVRLYRRYSSPPGRGRFRCELPNADNSSVNQTLYAIICEFITRLLLVCMIVS